MNTRRGVSADTYRHVLAFYTAIIDGSPDLIDALDPTPVDVSQMAAAFSVIVFMLADALADATSRGRQEIVASLITALADDSEHREPA